MGVKGDNFLIDRKDLTDPDCRTALTDFGTALMLKPNQRLRGKAGTERCWSPELYERNYGLKVDVWAMGVLVYGLIDGRFPFKDGEAVKTKEPEWPVVLPPDCKDFLRGMLEKCEAKRCTADEVMAHRWIRSCVHKHHAETTTSLKN